VLTIADLDDATIGPAAELVAADHAAAREAHPSLPEAFLDPGACAAALRRLLDDGHHGLVAVERGRALGLLTGIAHRTHGRLPADGVAVAPDLADPTTVLARLYAALAPRLLAAGALRHYLDHPAMPRLDAALANLGFGRHNVYATQPAALRPAERSGAGGGAGGHVRVRVAGEDDLDAVARLALVELRFRATPPIYGRPDDRTAEALAATHAALRDAGATHLLADLDGRAAGLLTIEPTSPAPRLCVDGEPYIGPTATDPDARGTGVGRALVDAALAWAHDHGHRWVSVDFDPPNPLSRPFWLGNGFRPVGYCVVRTIDPAHGPAG
jgi:GNAT superfamily N-acetyltransferase